MPDMPTELQVTRQVHKSKAAKPNAKSNAIGKPMWPQLMMIPSWCAKEGVSIQYSFVFLWQLQKRASSIGFDDLFSFSTCISRLPALRSQSIPRPKAFLHRSPPPRPGAFGQSTALPDVSVLGIDEVRRYHDMDRQLAPSQQQGFGVPPAVSLPTGIKPFSSAQSRTPRVSSSSVS
jgi:hypothetical protein